MKMPFSIGFMVMLAARRGVQAGMFQIEVKNMEYHSIVGQERPSPFLKITDDLECSTIY